jgi:hypothetical protein
MRQDGQTGTAKLVGTLLKIFIAKAKQNLLNTMVAPETLLIVIMTRLLMFLIDSCYTRDILGKRKVP